MSKPRILFFDIETTPLKAWVWSLGEQTVRHGQLCSGYSRYGIICITYCWNDGKPAKAIGWGYSHQDTAHVVQEFDKLIPQADIVIGKNSDSFDVRMINAARMFADLPGFPEWSKYTDDLEKQMRKYFRLPSQSLDYISKELGFGGKVKMEMDDWISIVEKNDRGYAAYQKMLQYGMKDVEDTRRLWEFLEKHFDPKYNATVRTGLDLTCKHCSSPNIRKNGTRPGGKTLWQSFFCNDCGMYAGRAAIRKNGKLGKIG